MVSSCILYFSTIHIIYVHRAGEINKHFHLSLAQRQYCCVPPVGMEILISREFVNATKSNVMRDVKRRKKKFLVRLKYVIRELRCSFFGFEFVISGSLGARLNLKFVIQMMLHKANDGILWIRTAVAATAAAVAVRNEEQQELRGKFIFVSRVETFGNQRWKDHFPQFAPK